MSNTGGYKVLPERLEAAIQTLFNRAGIGNRFFIYGVADRKLGHKVALVIEATGNHVRLIHDTLPSLKGKINPYEMPKEMLISPAFRLTDTGKINRAQTLKSVTQEVSLKK